MQETSACLLTSNRAGNVVFSQGRLLPSKQLWGALVPSARARGVPHDTALATAKRSMGKGCQPKNAPR